MKEIYGLILKYRFGAKFRFILIISTLFLLMIHIIALFCPFCKQFDVNQVQHLKSFSNSISNITVAIILMVLLVEGHNSMRSMIVMHRRHNYKDIGDQIIKWLSVTRSPIFEKCVIESKTIEELEILRNFKVIGNPRKIIDYYGFPSEFSSIIEDYCNKVHFEFTSYPCEIIYGIHLEFDNRELNENLAQEVNDILELSKQSAEIKEDNIIPKKPGWIFLTNTVKLAGDVDSDFATVLTYGRHFVELVCHCYDILYGKQMVDIFLRVIAGDVGEKKLLPSKPNSNNSV